MVPESLHRDYGVGTTQSGAYVFDAHKTSGAHVRFNQVFRHTVTKGATRPGDKFGVKYLYKVWKRACKNLKIDGVDLYGGTRHSTASALGEHFSVEQIMKAGSMHKTNKAAMRYIQNVKDESLMIYSKVAELNKRGEVVGIKAVKAK